ncbi:MAG: mechanosensitive ion channel family protein [Candidatus Diapherotrites archaeon]|uniref:Mechanosensitive ion channel family protein n=1 Tax=Candidatus Iainarchaeum sp. TaxID=3101447 RepID=A0A7J4ITQ2_9ARCH|nr:MAG: MscS mechanosensitive ion channel [archaeon GW2011_AR10]MBS3059339.1 mechanosensitive ion channel family protein [Candidatus Diapherotrites archaeon]HIH08210.1 mechanosensitive ion channel family protein [Candidatus Diapherotrites archaeon]
MAFFDSLLVLAESDFFSIAAGIGILLVIYLVFTFALNKMKKTLIGKAKTKKQVSNVEIFSKLIRYTALFLLAIAVIFYYSGSITGIGLTFGLFSAALGFALQKPIAGIAAWAMVVTKRPFEIGDRIIIGNIKGDVSDITLTHIYIHEIGGTIGTETVSGRTIMVPNAVLFEQNIINYTFKDELVLSEVNTNVTYESNLKKAMKIVLTSAVIHTKEYSEKTDEEPEVRVLFLDSGIKISVQYFTHAKRLAETASNITQEIFDRISKADDVEIAYPHTQVVFTGKTGKNFEQQTGKK